MFIFRLASTRADRAGSKLLFEGRFGRDRYGFAISEDAGAAATVETGGVSAV